MKYIFGIVIFMIVILSVNILNADILKIPISEFTKGVLACISYFAAKDYYGNNIKEK